MSKEIPRIFIFTTMDDKEYEARWEISVIRGQQERGLTASHLSGITNSSPVDVIQDCE